MGNTRDQEVTMVARVHEWRRDKRTASEGSIL